MGNNDEIKERLRTILEVKNMSVSRITEGEEVKRSTLSAQINGSSAVSAETIRLFLRKFNDLSAEWLMRGVGDMFCHGDSNTEIQQTNAQGDNSTNTQIVGSDCAVLQKENEMLKKQLADKDKEIEFLRCIINK